MFQVYFVYNGTWYHSAEQAFTHQLALICEAKGIAERVLLAVDGYEAKEIAKSLEKSEKWLANRDNVLYNVQKAKFWCRRINLFKQFKF